MAEVERAQDVERALKAFVREEFQSPVLALRGQIDLLIDDAVSSGAHGNADDLARMRAASERLFALVSAILAGTADVPTGEVLRHDLKTPVTAVIGYAELLVEEQEETGETTLAGGLASVLAASRRLLSLLDSLVTLREDTTHAREPARDAIVEAVAFVNDLRDAPSRDKGTTGRVLVVDDDDLMRDLTARRLSREGHAVTTCANGEAALGLCRDDAFDLMLLDLMMPGLSGLEVLDRLRKDGGASPLPVIVVSALDEIEAVVRCIEAGADDYLTKPLDETLLRARIGHSLERKLLRDRERETYRQLEIERERSEKLLRNVLPEAVVRRLQSGETVIADYFEDVSVMFCDLVGFTALSESIAPDEVLSILNEIFSGFDALAAQRGLEKIKTIGDAYMAVGGMSRGDRDHACRIADMACRMPEIVEATSRRTNMSLAIRAGIATGSAAGGIVGSSKFFYDVWGDTVNLASRLEALCEPGRVHVSASTAARLADDFRIERRDDIFIKGKGNLFTYYVQSLV